MQSLLVLILDVNPSSWASLSSSAPNFASAVEQIQLFLNSHLLCDQSNRIAVIACHSAQSTFLYPRGVSDEASESKKDTKGVAVSDAVRMSLSIQSGIMQALSSADDKGSGTKLAGALSMALCYINKQRQESKGKQHARVLVVSASPDSSPQYVPIMNCIFSAMKQDVMVDACVLSFAESLFLQQACHLTRGIYYQWPSSSASASAFLQCLLMNFSPDAPVRPHLTLPTQVKVDFRATCFCHKQVIDTGVVCPVCLSIFCKESPICKTCKTRFLITPALPLSAAAAPSMHK